MVNLSPTLRFPEFSGNWKQKKLEEVGSVINGLTYSPDDIHDDGVLVLRSSNVKENQLSFNDNVYVNADNYNAVKENDILICVRNGSRNLIGKNALITREAEGLAFGAFMSVYRSELNKFVFQLFATDTYYKIIQENLGATINSINNSDLKKFEFYFPLKEEQDKIADFLSEFDKKINQLSKKKELLEQYKKGIMQKIFNQEIRFKDDNVKDFPDWVEKKLGECLEFEQPTKYIVSSTEYDDDYTIPVLTAGKSFILGYTNEKCNIFNDLPVIIFDDFTTATQFVNFPFKVKSSAMKILKAKHSFDIKFVYEAMQMLNYEIGGHGRHWISIFSNLLLFIPCLEEQNKIANFLSAIDDKISQVNTQLENTKKIKSGLLQLMFIS
jgi:type I restriction enzyme S subunit